MPRASDSLKTYPASRGRRRLALGTALVLSTLAGAWPALGEPEAELGLRELDRVSRTAALADPPLPDTSTFPVQLVIDDDAAEGVFGIFGGTARQFLWFNSFPDPGPFTLEEVWVLFPSGTDVGLGDAVQLAIYQDADGDPTNGADLLGTYDVTVQAVDGNTFSVFPLAPSLDLAGGGDVMIGVVNRYYQTGVDPPPTEPSAVDTTTGQGRSYFALWSGDAPAAPDLASAIVIGALSGPSDGNHMIRGFGSILPTVDVPTLGTRGLLLLIAALALVGSLLVVRSKS